MVTDGVEESVYAGYYSFSKDRRAAIGKAGQNGRAQKIKSERIKVH